MITRIGIDFGTCKTVMHVKNYDANGKMSARDRLSTRSVQFGSADAAPTIARQLADGTWVWGHHAMADQKGSVLYRNFKDGLTDPQKKAMARKLTRGFFSYLREQYRGQNSVGSFSGTHRQTETIVSYPVRWKKDEVDFLLQAAREAGFENVSGMDENEAAVVATLHVAQMYLRDMGFEKEKKTIKLLVADMGERSVQLAVGECTLCSQPLRWKMISFLPADDSACFCGGREIDDRLTRFIADTLRAYGEESGEAATYLKLLQNPQHRSALRTWKETVVEPTLNRRGMVKECGVMTACTGGNNVPFEPLDRVKLEALLGDYISQLIERVNFCLQSDPQKGKPIDVVLLAGGNSFWHFVLELFAGRGIGHDRIVLEGIQAQKQPLSRIMRLPKSQETIAQGLALSALPLELDKERKAAADAPKKTEEARKNAAANKPDKTNVGNKPNEPDKREAFLAVLREQIHSIPWSRDKCNYLIRKGEKSIALDQAQTLKNFIAKYKQSGDIEYYFWHDNSMLSNGKGEGFAISEKGLHFKPTISGFRFIPWELVIKKEGEGGFAAVLKENGDLKIGCSGWEEFLFLNINFPQEDAAEVKRKPERVFRLLNYMRDYGHGIAPKMAASTSRSREKTLFLDALKSEIRRIPWSRNKGNYLIREGENAIALDQAQTLKNFITKYRLDDQIEYYCWHDESMFETGKGEGFAISEKGLHFQPFWSPFRFVSWEQIVSASTEDFYAFLNDNAELVVSSGKWTDPLYLRTNFPQEKKEDIQKKPKMIYDLFDVMKRKHGHLLRQ